MSVSELVVFIALMCNIDQPSVPRVYKEECVSFYANCAIVDDVKVDRMKLSNCIQKAKTEQKYWR